MVDTDFIFIVWIITSLLRSTLGYILIGTMLKNKIIILKGSIEISELIETKLIEDSDITEA